MHELPWDQVGKTEHVFAFKNARCMAAERKKTKSRQVELFFSLTLRSKNMVRRHETLQKKQNTSTSVFKKWTSLLLTCALTFYYIQCHAWNAAKDVSSACLEKQQKTITNVFWANGSLEDSLLYLTENIGYWLHTNNIRILNTYFHLRLLVAKTMFRFT